MRRRALAIVLAGACGRNAPPLASCLEVVAPAVPVGFDAPLSIAAQAVCPDVRGGRVTWRQLAGPALRALATANDGFRLTARTPPLADVVPGPLPWGIVPLSPRTRGEIVLEARWSDGRGRELSREVRVAAASRARGLPSTPVGARVYLGGEGWRLGARPDGSAATLTDAGGVASLLPDVAGEWQLSDGHGRTLAVRAGRYDDTPLDCGRAGCHAAITEAAAPSPMTTVLARGLEAPHGPEYPGCALACHATGEPGIADGGFSHVAAELGLGATDMHGAWTELPRALRRLGGAGCLGCHGPGAIPEASARWSILRADVCAVCHDAPPRYGHVAAWRATRMARADHDARARSDAACVRCHTTWGFLGSKAERRPPDDVGLVGIACAACHAPHPTPAAAPARALLRAADVCSACHTPDADAGVPSASAAALWRGRGGLDPASGDALDGPAPHAAVAAGCTGCHRGHDFAAAPATCAGCHAKAPVRSDVAARARRLWEPLSLTLSPPSGERGLKPIHAGDVRLDLSTPLGRAAWDVLLVLEDPAAAVHNGAYARALLDAAEPVLARGGRP